MTKACHFSSAAKLVLAPRVPGFRPAREAGDGPRALWHSGSNPPSRKKPERPRPMTDLTHIDDKGRAAMVDVTARDDTERSATAGRSSRFPRDARAHRRGQAAKGDVIAAARRRHHGGEEDVRALIPLCHPADADRGRRRDRAA